MQESPKGSFSCVKRDTRDNILAESKEESLYRLSSFLESEESD